MVSQTTVKNEKAKYIGNRIARLQSNFVNVIAAIFFINSQLCGTEFVYVNALDQHWFSYLLQDVVITTYGAIIDDRVGIMTTLGVQGVHDDQRVQNFVTLRWIRISAFYIHIHIYVLM